MTGNNNSQPAHQPLLSETSVSPSNDPFDQGQIQTRTDEVLDKIVRPVGWFVPAVAAISVYEIFTRYALNSPTTWVHETSTFLIAIVFLVGGVRAMARNQHVKINLVQFLLPAKYQPKLALINKLLLVLICAALVYVSALTAWDATHARPGLPFYLERSGTFWNPPMPGLTKVVLFLTCLLLFFQSVAQFFRTFHDNRARNQRVDL